MGVSLKQTLDLELIKSIMTLPEVIDKASNQNEVIIEPEISHKSAWFLGCCDGKLVGIINAIHFNSNTLELHPYSLSPKHSRLLIYSFFDLFLTLPPHIIKMQCFIPECFKKTLNFALKVGFIDEGYLKESYNRNNQLYGVFVLGITRKEIEAQDGKNS